MSPVSRVMKQPGGDTNHNIFSWSDPPTADCSSTGAATAASAGKASLANIGSSADGGLSAPLRTSVRTSQGHGTSQIVFGDDGTSEPTRVKPSSFVKQRELLGSGIFSNDPISVSSSAFANNNDQNCGNVITDRPSVRLHQPAGGVSQIVFGESEPPIPQKRISSQKATELGGMSWNEGDGLAHRHPSEQKIKELCGTAPIFSADSDMNAAQVDSDGTLRVSEKVEELRGRGLFVEERGMGAHGGVSDGKVKELQGHGQILSCSTDDAATSLLQQQQQDAMRRSRRTPGGNSSIVFG
eukprot:TRINITY_DN304_c0_g1_i2.p1 TRINITY_DN304_c0_g1~~TRINITY_DN304_c0_g1_i2.p1  ORF type:complete len:297 (+),score=79.61 TRINITY_DN304_c0_g1_i2:89-979(+)